MTKSYSQKLRDPQWQKKRLEIMNRDEFCCQKCGDASQTLNVHHCYYEYGNDPWNYNDESLITLCEPCHKEETDLTKDKKLLVRALELKGFLCEEIHELSCAFHNSILTGKDLSMISALSWAIENPIILTSINNAYFRMLKMRNWRHKALRAAKELKNYVNS